MLRIATFHAELSRKGPGLLLRDILKGDAQADAAARVIARAGPDILVLNGIDYDHDHLTLKAFAALIAREGHAMPHLFALRPNAGWMTGHDLDGDGRLGGPGDAHGWGRFAGDGGMAVLSRHPLGEARDLSRLIWAELPWAGLPEREGRVFPSEEALAVQRLSSVGHWIVPVEIGGRRLDVMAFHAATPVFDGPEDRNGKRNHDEIMLWQHLLDGDLEGGPPAGAFVIAGDANLDPEDGEGLREAIRGLLSDERLQDPLPESDGGRLAADAGQKGDPARDTVDWPGAEADGPGNLRVDYVLPSAGLEVLGAGVLWPAPGEAGPGGLGHDTVAAASRHRLVWVDIRW